MTCSTRVAFLWFAHTRSVFVSASSWWRHVRAGVRRYSCAYPSLVSLRTAAGERSLVDLVAQLLVVPPVKMSYNNLKKAITDEQELIKLMQQLPEAELRYARCVAPCTSSFYACSRVAYAPSVPDERM